VVDSRGTRVTGEAVGIITRSPSVNLVIQLTMRTFTLAALPVVSSRSRSIRERHVEPATAILENEIRVSRSYNGPEQVRDHGRER
jgi:hypothetical protein